LVMIALYTITFNALAVTPTAHGELSSDMFADSDKCSQCHAITHDQWKGTMHYNAYEDPFYQKEVLAASNDTQGIVDEFCSRCHTPIGVVSGEIPPVGGANLSAIAREGVQCDFCHVISASNGTGNAPFVVSPGNIKWGPFDDSKSAYHESEYLELYTTSEYCGMCHEVTHPLNGLVVDDTYTVWKEGPYAEEGVECQDCHMTSGITKFEANPGRAGSGAQKREHISTHAIVGGNAFITEILGEEKYKEMAVERLKKTANLSIDAPQIGQRGDNLSLNISITNSGAGHKIPTGVSEIRQMWLAVSVKDGSGKQVYNTGDVYDNGTVGNSKIYNTVLGDAQGQPTLSFWLAQSILEDNRIPPRGTVSEKHSFRIPEDVTYPLAIEATLQYRSAPQDIIDHLFGEDVYEVPVISMTEISTNIYENEETAAVGAADAATPSTPGVDSLSSVTILLCAAYFYMGRRKI
jgi:mono/diheme cytochrome c family protein